MGEKINPSWGESFGERPQYVVRSSDNTQDVLVQNEDRFNQVFSGYDQYDLLQKFRFVPNKNAEHILNFQYSNSTNIPRYDRLTDPQGSGLRFSEWYYGPQQRLLVLYTFKLHNLGEWADNFNLVASFQDIEESRHNRRFNNNSLSNRHEHVNVFGLTADFQKQIRENKIRYGLDGQFNTLKSTAFSEDIVTGAQSPLDTRYPDGDNYMNQVSVYGTHTYEISNHLVLNDGLRVGGSWLYSSFVDKTFFPFPYDEVRQNSITGSANVGLIYLPSSWKFSIMASTGFRVPNVDDLGKVFESQPGTVIVPNPELGPEKTINGDIGITKFFGSKARIEGSFYITDFYDAIVTVPGTFNGQSVIDYEGVPSQVMENANAGRAYLFGFALLGKAELAKDLTLSASYNYTHGRVKNDTIPNTPLDHIPPTFGRVSLQYVFNKVNAEIFSNFNGWKRISDYGNSGEDNPQYATPDGMPSWYTLNFRLSVDATRFLNVQIGMDNILDLQYRTFASGINAPGRNLFGTVRLKF
ncbi:MAG: TonB-dependent receptor [Flammeovirgaceae bacterium]|nr:TonB-dependent receptor [Flammeovirgaceae bacterium]